MSGVTEKDLATELGVTRSWLKEQRENPAQGLQEGAEGHWFNDLGGKGIVYSSRGVQAIRGLLATTLAGQSDGKATPPEIEQELREIPASAEPVVVELIVANNRYNRNPRILLCEDEAKALQRVMVRTNVNFRPGMTVRAQHVDEDRWCLAQGQRLPRFPGRY